ALLTLDRVVVLLDPKERPHADGKLVLRDRLRDEVVGAGLERPHAVLLHARGHQHDRQETRVRARAKAPGQLVAVHPGHEDVQQHDIRVLADRDGDAVLGARRLERAHAGVLQQVAGELHVLLVVLDDQDEIPIAHALTLSGAGVRSGKVKVNVLPRPIALSTQIRPPCSSTNRFASARPRPVPSRERSEARRACWDSSRTRSWSSGAMPIPVSRTVTTTSPLPRRAATSTRPPSAVNLTAFES